MVPEHWTCPEWRIELKENERGECAWMNGKYELTTDSIRCDNYECGSSTYVGCFDTADEAKALAQRLQDVLDGRDAVSEAVERIVEALDQRVKESEQRSAREQFHDPEWAKERRGDHIYDPIEPRRRGMEDAIALLRSRDWSKGEGE